MIIQNNSGVEIELKINVVLGQLRSLEDSSKGEEWVRGGTRGGWGHEHTGDT